MEKTTPSNSPLHRGKDEREKAPRCSNAACPPPFQGGARGGSIINLKSKIKTWFTLISY